MLCNNIPILSFKMQACSGRIRNNAGLPRSEVYTIDIFPVLRLKRRNHRYSG
nr:MAG TPA: hypothetical protein [Caudoviricetes sp.]